MRTTVTLDADVAADIKRRTRSTGRTFRDVLNEAVRAGLRAQNAPQARRYRLKPSSLGGVVPGVNIDRALRLADALDDLATLRKLELRK